VHRFHLLIVTFLLGCGAKSGLVVEERSTDGADLGSPPDGSPLDSGVARPPRACPSRPRPVDLVFVTDTSGSMIDELATLADEVPTFLLDLLQPPDRDGDGVADWPAVEDLQVAVAPTGLGGELSTTGDMGRSECAGSYPIFHRLQPGGEVLASAERISCVATTTYTRSDEAMFGTVARALLPSSSMFRVPGGPNLGDRAHRGFLRAGSLLVLLFITDEDDATPCVVDTSPECALVDCRMVGMRRECRTESRVDAYVDMIRSLRPAEDLFVGTLAGAPVDATTEEAILESFEAVSPTSSLCRNGLLSGLAAPRMARFTFALGGAYRSICSESYGALTQPLAERVGRRACAP